jgi:hypothetical protein
MVGSRAEKKSYQVWLYGHILPQVTLIFCDCIIWYKILCPTVLLCFIVITDKTRQNIGQGRCALIKLPYRSHRNKDLCLFVAIFIFNFVNEYM